MTSKFVLDFTSPILLMCKRQPTSCKTAVLVLRLKVYLQYLSQEKSTTLRCNGCEVFVRHCKYNHFNYIPLRVLDNDIFSLYPDRGEDICTHGRYKRKQLLHAYFHFLTVFKV